MHVTKFKQTLHIMHNMYRDDNTAILETLVCMAKIKDKMTVQLLRLRHSCRGPVKYFPKTMHPLSAQDLGIRPCITYTWL